MRVEIALSGYGGEIVLGTVDKNIFDYFQEHDIDISEFSNDWDNDLDVPENMRPFAPCEWHECDDIAHRYGVEMHEYCRVVVIDLDTDTTLLESNLDISSLDANGISSSCLEEVYVDHFSDKVVFTGQSVEKGTFFNVVIEIEDKFDPTKLELDYDDIDGWTLCSSVKYDGVELYDEGVCTTGKSMNFYMVHVQK
jgi:hypothetical protein